MGWTMPWYTITDRYSESLRPPAHRSLYLKVRAFTHQWVIFVLSRFVTSDG